MKSVTTPPLSLTSIIIVVPLTLTHKDNYKLIIPSSEFNDKTNVPLYYGLMMGLSSVVVGHFFTLLYFYLLREKYILFRNNLKPNCPH